MYLDNSSQMTYEEIQHKKFQPTQTEEIKLGYSQATVWIKFTITNKLNKPLDRYLILNKPILDVIDLFEKEEQKYKKTTKGILSLRESQQNNILHPSFHIDFEPYETKSYYLKIHSTLSANNFQVHLKDTQTLYEDEFTYQIIKTVFLGAMLGLVIYNLFLFFFIKEYIYLYYVLYMFFLTAYYITYTQIINYIFIYPQVSYAIYFIGLANIFALLFIKTFLKIKSKILTYIIYTIIALYILFMLSSLSIILVTQLTVINLVFILYLCFNALYQRNDQIKYIFIGWVLMIIGTLMRTLKVSGNWSVIDYFPYFYESTILAEAILFSVALAARLNKNKELEKSLKTNTILIKELHHRVKNNMQFIIIMYRLKLDKIMNSSLDQNLKEAEGTIQAMSKTYEILYSQEDLETIDTKEYLDSLISEIKKSFDTPNIDIHLNIDTQLTMNQSIYSGIILNELMTNTLKYAFPNEQGEIWISLKKEENETEFIFRDNGVGFDENTQNQDTFGLSFIEALVTDELHGSVNINSSDGVHVRIKF